MASTFTWLDYSEHERRRMLDVIDLFGERTTRDELGIGGIRDALADLLFPGTTTIQTVAKYFLIVPWMYRDLERRKVPSTKIKSRARQFEVTVAKNLGNADGTIGRLAKEKLKRLPSSVYWQGLAVWGIRLFPGSHDAYQRSLDLFYARRKAQASSHSEFDGEGTFGQTIENWHSGLPEAPPGFPDEVTLELNEREAAYLREQVLTNCSDSLLAYLLRYHVPVDACAFPWQVEEQLPDHLANQLQHARNFSEAIHGGQLLYNLMLAEQSDQQELVKRYRSKLDQWCALIESRRGKLQDWNHTDFWTTVYRQNPRISAPARRFVDGWLQLVDQAPSLPDIVESEAARKLIEFRELQLKGSLARTRNQRALELWTGAAGSEQLEFRWTTTRRIIGDILQGLESTTDA